VNKRIPWREILSALLGAILTYVCTKYGVCSP
jgi:hypothetical protein